MTEIMALETQNIWIQRIKTQKISYSDPQVRNFERTPPKHSAPRPEGAGGRREPRVGARASGALEEGPQLRLAGFLLRDLI